MEKVGIYKDATEGPTIRRDITEREFSVKIRDINCIRGDQRERTVAFVMRRFGLFLDGIAEAI